MYRIIISSILILQFSFACQAPEKAEQTESIQYQSAQEMDAVSDHITVIAHRGDWRHAPENSLQAIKNCIEMGVDMVEIDVRLTKDSVLVLMHDATIDRTTTGSGFLSEWTYDGLKTLYLMNGANRPTHHQIPTLEEALLLAKDKIMINLDKCYDYFDLVYKVLQETETADQVIMKGKVPVAQLVGDYGDYLTEVKFMPIISLNEPEASMLIEDYMHNMQPYAIEFTYRTDTSKILDQFQQFTSEGTKVWVNTLWESLNAGYEDDMAVINPDSIYGWHISKGVNMIQTDRPALLLNYLREEGLHE